MQGQTTFEVPKAKLLETLKVNRKKHVANFDKATAAFKIAAVKELEFRLTEARLGNIKLHSELEKPSSYVKNYDKVIGMLEFTIEETITVSWDDFESYVNDQWTWSNRFEVANSRYLG